MQPQVRRAETTTNVIMWFATIAAVMIIVIWYTTTLQVTGINLPAIDEDLKNIHFDISLACQNEQVITNVKINTPQGIFNYTSDEICINVLFAEGGVSRCLSQGAVFQPDYAAESRADYAEGLLPRRRAAATAHALAGAARAP